MTFSGLCISFFHLHEHIYLCVQAPSVTKLPHRKLYFVSLYVDNPGNALANPPSFMLSFLHAAMFESFMWM